LLTFAHSVIRLHESQTEVEQDILWAK
jgi:hypothetical protein